MCKLKMQIKNLSMNERSFTGTLNNNLKNKKTTKGMHVIENTARARQDENKVLLGFQLQYYY